MTQTRATALMVSLFLAWPALAADPVRPPPLPDPLTATNDVLKAVRPIGPGRFQIGKVVLDQHQQLLTLPAVVNMNTGVVEYLLVSNQGKTHESVLRTEVEPYQIHVAMLLLGAKGAGTNHSSRPALGLSLPGDPVTIHVRWGTNDSTAEELVLYRQTHTPPSPGPWVYTGSRNSEGVFAAQRDGSIISIIEDLDALVNNPRPGRDNDDLWAANHDKLPAIGTPLELRIRLLRQ